MSRIQVVTRETGFAYDAQRDDVINLTRSRPRTRATMAIPVGTAVRTGWSLFWRSLWWAARGRKDIEFWMEGDG